jgi:hypothetical protein
MLAEEDFMVLESTVNFDNDHSTSLSSDVSDLDLL